MFRWRKFCSGNCGSSLLTPVSMRKILFSWLHGTAKKKLTRQLRDSTRDLAQAKERIGKLDGIIQRLCEDNVEGKISDERFAKLSASYETEQNQLESRKAELTELIAASKE